MTVGDSDFPYDAFISYSHVDQRWVRDWLVPRLEETGFRVCVDYEKFDVGVPSLTNMERAVEQSRKTVLVLTPSWTESDWANFESLLAQTDDPRGRLRRMLPLMLKPCTPRSGIRIFTHADFTDPERWEDAFASLVRALRDEHHLPPKIDVPRFTASYRTPFILPQLDVPTFSGRREELTKLEDLLLKQGGSKVCSIAGLAGSGGIGKSALACHFAELHREDFPGGVIGLRVDGKDVDALAREFTRHVGEEIDPEDERDAATIMQDVFGHRRALLIFDNADDAGVAALRPGGGTCAVIVTTRDRLLPFLLGIPEDGRVDLSPLPYADALLLLERLLGKERVAAGQSAADEIIELVGGLPLALQIVGATLQMQVLRGLDDYAASLRAERERLSKLQVRGEAHLDVRASFSLSLKLLRDEEVDFFACLSVCAQDGFSVRAATAAAGCEEDSAHERLGQLFRLSLVNLHQSGTSRFVLHPLLRLFAQELSTERSLRDAAAERHARHYVELVKSSAADALLAAELDDIIVAAEWLQSHDEADYDFVISLEPFLQNNGYWQQAVEMMAGFLRMAERVEDWEAAVQLCIQKAKFLSLRGDWVHAEGALAPVEDILGRIEATYSRVRLQGMWLNTLGGIQQRQGRFDEALETFTRGQTIFSELGEQRGLARVLNSLGGVLQRMGRFDEALETFERSRAISEELSDRRGLAMVLNSLGGLLQRMGHFDEALETFERSRVISEELGDRHGQSMVLNSLGGVLQRMGRFDEALETFERSRIISEELSDRRSLAMVLNSLGGVLQRMGRFDEAAEAFGRSRAISEELGDRHGLAMVLNSLGGVLQRMGRFDEALETFERSRAISEELGDRRSLAMVFNSLGGVLQRMGRFDEAAEAFGRSRAIREELGDRHGLAMVLNSLGGVLQRMGRFDEALETFTRGQTIFSELSDWRGQSMVLNSLGGVLQRMGCFDEAIDAFRKSAAIAEEVGDERGQAMILNSLGSVLQRQGRLDEAVRAFERSFDLQIALGDARGQAMVLTSLSSVFQRQERFERAAETIRQSIKIEERLNNRRGLAMALNSLGGVLKRQGHYEEAVDAFRRSIEIEEQLDNRRGQSMVLNSLGGVLQQMGRFDEAIGAFRRSYDLAVAQKDRRGQAMILTALGKALLARRDTEEALADLREAFAIDEALRNSRGISIVAPTLIHALIGLGSRAEALDYCQRALALDPESRRLLNLREELLAPPKSAGSTELIRGTVKRDLILHSQGYRYGFISPDDGSSDIYFRDTAVDEGLLASLKSGLRVDAEVRPGRKGREATSIKAVTE